MAVRILLDRPHSFFTNLDPIGGKVVLSVPNEETINAIVVKLEGESRTRLAAPIQAGPAYRDRHERFQTELEVHKVSK